MFATRLVDAPVDPREPRRDLVDRAVQVVDPPLQRDGEVDEVALAAAEQNRLAIAQRAGSAASSQTTDDERDDGDRGSADRDPGGGRATTRSSSLRRARR